jgi:hypothetical protein
VKPTVEVPIINFHDHGGVQIDPFERFTKLDDVPVYFGQPHHMENVVGFAKCLRKRDFMYIDALITWVDLNTSRGHSRLALDHLWNLGLQLYAGANMMRKYDTTNGVKAYVEMVAIELQSFDSTQLGGWTPPVFTWP